MVKITVFPFFNCREGVSWPLDLWSVYESILLFHCDSVHHWVCKFLENPRDFNVTVLYTFRIYNWMWAWLLADCWNNTWLQGCLVSWVYACVTRFIPHRVMETIRRPARVVCCFGKQGSGSVIGHRDKECGRAFSYGQSGQCGEGWTSSWDYIKFVSWNPSIPSVCCDFLKLG